MSSSTSEKKEKSTKHVSRACLGCRSKHLKCDGTEPVCLRCQKAGKECEYVKSHRGGSRKKGISKKQKLNPEHESPESIDLRSSTSTLVSSSSSSTTPRQIKAESHGYSNDADSFILPCVKNNHPEMTNRHSCEKQCLNPESFNKLPACLTGPQFKKKTNDEDINFHPKFNASREKPRAIDLIFDRKNLKSPNDYYMTPSLVKSINVESVINKYYSHFHNQHPFMPQREDIDDYLLAIPHKYDLLLAMKLIGDGQSSSIYSRDVETVNFMINNILDYSKQVGKDFVTLQSLLMISMVSHISSLHNLSVSLRESVVALTLELNLNMIDQNDLPSLFMDVNGYITDNSNSNMKNGINLMHTPSDVDAKENDVITKLLTAPRLANVSDSLLRDVARRTLWEVYFFDTLSGTASGCTMSDLSTTRMLTLYPQAIPAKVFDYKSRAECCKLVNDSIKLNLAIQDNKETTHHLVHMKAAIGNWDMRIENPDAYNAPYLVDTHGVVNEGVHQSITLVTYAKIFTHRPFSYLWRPNVSRHPRCMGDSTSDEDCQDIEKEHVDARQIIETRRTIDSASAVVKLLIDTNPAKILQRTPFYACSLAFACLVHLSAYSWVESSLQAVNDGGLDRSMLKDSVSNEELDVYSEYIKLEMSGIFQISRHWALSSKLIQHIKETLMKVSPKLYKRVQTSLPESHQPSSSEVTPTRSVTPPSKVISINTLPPRSHNSYTDSYRSISPSLTSATRSTIASAASIDLNQNASSTPQLETQDKVEQDTPLTMSTTNSSTSQIHDTSSAPFTSISTNNNASIHNINGANTALSEMDFNVVFDENDLMGMSPTSDTGCDWVDKNIFEFADFNLS